MSETAAELIIKAIPAPLYHEATMLLAARASRKVVKPPEGLPVAPPRKDAP